jgi:hypothetical protein
MSATFFMFELFIRYSSYVQHGVKRMALKHIKERYFIAAARAIAVLLYKKLDQRTGVLV